MAFTISYKMLFRKGETASSILAIALLVAIISSTNTILNYLNLQSETLATLVNPRGTYLIISTNSTAVTDSKIDANLTTKLSNLSYIKHLLPQKILTANLTTNISSHKILVRGVEDINTFLKLRGAYLNGTAPKNWREANIGELLARASSINLGDEISLTLGERQLKLKVVGIFRSHTQSDTELLLPLKTANTLSGNNDTLSIIEFTLKEGTESRKALDQITQLLPEDTKIVQTQQLKTFAQQTNTQVATFLNIWSIAVYAAVAATSYIASTRLITESTYELTTLRAIGARKRLTITLILAHTITIASIGSILGIAVGTAGTQIASTLLRWITQTIDITPFLEAEQALRILFLTLTSSTIGCIYPALKTIQTRYTEQPL